MEPDVEGIKVKINTFVWMHLPGTTTLDRAEEISCEILRLILNEYPEEEQGFGQPNS